MSSIKLAFINIKKNIKNEKELKTSFIISVLGMALNNIAFLFIWYYFGVTMGNLNGWEPIDVFGLYAFSGISYGIVSTFFSGIFNLPSYIVTANLDKYLLTPKNILLKISTSAISTSALGDLLFGFVCFIIYAIYSKLIIVQYLLSLLLLVLASIIFFAFALICMSISFYLMDGENISSAIYGTFISNSLYHGGAFTGVLRLIFIFVIPSLLMGAVPVEIIKSLSYNDLLIMIFLTIIWFTISILFFYKSLKRYESNNLFGFGN